MADAVIFDLDGVLVESESHWLASESSYLRQLLPDWSDRDQSRLFGLSIRDCFRLLVKDYGLTHGWEDFISHYDALAGEIYGKKAELIFGVDRTIANLASAGLKIGLASNCISSWMELVLDRFDLNRLIDAAVSSDDVAGQGKPDPAIYLECAKRLGILPLQAIAIEDSSKGIASAKSAGMYCIGFRNGANQHKDLSLADVEAKSMAEVEQLVLRTRG